MWFTGKQTYILDSYCYRRKKNANKPSCNCSISLNLSSSRSCCTLTNSEFNFSCWLIISASNYKINYWMKYELQNLLCNITFSLFALPIFARTNSCCCNNSLFLSISRNAFTLSSCNQEYLINYPFFCVYFFVIYKSKKISLKKKLNYE